MFIRALVSFLGAFCFHTSPPSPLCPIRRHSLRSGSILGEARPYLGDCPGLFPAPRQNLGPATVRALHGLSLMAARPPKTSAPSRPPAWTNEEWPLSLLLPSSDPKTKQPNGSKHKLTKAASLPGKNGNPTFAAVTAGYDKSPGEWLGVLSVTSGFGAQ